MKGLSPVAMDGIRNPRHRPPGGGQTQHTGYRRQLLKDFKQSEWLSGPRALWGRWFHRNEGAGRLIVGVCGSSEWGLCLENQATGAVTFTPWGDCHLREEWTGQ